MKKTKILTLLKQHLLAFTILIAACSAAFGAQPIRIDNSGSATGVITDIAPFDITVDATITSTETFYLNSDGVITRLLIHQTEQDVYSANGKSLTSLPYTFNVEIVFDAAGNIATIHSSGLTTKIWLPDGSLFVGAGRVDLTLHPNAVFILSPDHGNPGNVQGFIDALSP